MVDIHKLSPLPVDELKSDKVRFGLFIAVIVVLLIAIILLVLKQWMPAVGALVLFAALLAGYAWKSGVLHDAPAVQEIKTGAWE